MIDHPQQAVPKVFIVDDDAAVRKSLGLVLALEGLQVCTYDCAEAFLASDLSQCCGCAIIDMHMPGMSGLELQQALVAKHIPLPVVILTGYGAIPSSVAAIKSGVEDYLVKPVTREKLLATVQAALANGERMRAKAARRQVALLRLQYLTKREREIMLLAINGSSDKEIARNLNISYRTVEKHKSSLLHKTGSKHVLDLLPVVWECELAAGDNSEH